MKDFIVYWIGVLPGWGRALLLAALVLLVVVAVRKIRGNPLGSLRGTQYFFGFLLAFILSGYVVNMGLLTPLFLRPGPVPDPPEGVQFATEFGFSLFPYDLEDFFGQLTIFVPVGMLLLATFRVRFQKLGEVCAMAFALSLLIVATQYYLWPAAFNLFEILANTFWAAMGFLLYRYARNALGKSALDQGGISE